MILYESHLVKVEFDPSVPTVIWTPLEFMSGEQFTQPFVVGMDFFEKKVKEIPNLGWLNDTRRVNSVKIEDVKWLDKNVNDRAYEVGGKKVAFVLPENIFGKMSVRFYIKFTNERMDNKLEIKAFEKLAQAKLWLKGADDVQLSEITL